MDRTIPRLSRRPGAGYLREALSVGGDQVIAVGPLATQSRGVELAASTTTPDPRRPAGPAEPPSRLRASQEGSSTGYVPYDRWLSAACETAATDHLVLVSRWFNGRPTTYV